MGWGGGGGLAGRCPLGCKYWGGCGRGGQDDDERVDNVRMIY